MRISFVKWMTLASLAYAICEFLLLALVGIAIRATIRSLWLPYLLLLGCWAVFAPLVYWVNGSHNSTKTYAGSSLQSSPFTYPVSHWRWLTAW